MSSLYHEQQLSALCGVHALNNLMQGPVCGAGDLAPIAHQLDEAERALLDPSDVAAAGTASHRIDVNTGDFSLEVLAMWALETHGVSLINADHASVAEGVASTPETEEGFLVHRSSHWFALRRVASLWWNLDSKLRRPLLIANDDLGEFIRRLRVDGHTLHVVRCATPLPLPQGDVVGGAGREAVYHPIDYLLSYPSLDPADRNSYHVGGLLAELEAAGAEEADSQAADERAAAAMQAREWGGLGGAAGPNAIASLGSAGMADTAMDTDAALAAALMAEEMEALDRSEQSTAAALGGWRGGGGGGGGGTPRIVGALGSELSGLGSSVSQSLSGFGSNVATWFNKQRAAPSADSAGGEGSAQPSGPASQPLPSLIDPRRGQPLDDSLPLAQATLLPEAPPQPLLGDMRNVAEPLAIETPSSTLADSMAATAAPLVLADMAAQPTQMAQPLNQREDQPIDPFPSAATRAPPPGVADESEANVRVADLLAMGFAFDDVHRALDAAAGDVSLAQEILLEGDAAMPTHAPQPQAATATAAADASSRPPPPPPPVLSSVSSESRATPPPQTPGILIPDVD